MPIVWDAFRNVVPILPSHQNGVNGSGFFLPFQLTRTKALHSLISRSLSNGSISPTISRMDQVFKTSTFLCAVVEVLRNAPLALIARRFVLIKEGHTAIMLWLLAWHYHDGCALQVPATTRMRHPSLCIRCAETGLPVCQLKKRLVETPKVAKVAI